MSAGYDSQSRDYYFSQLMEANGLIDTLYKIPRRDCLGWSTYEEVKYMEGRATGALVRRRSSTESWFGIESQPVLQDCVNVLSGNFAIAPFAARIACLYWLFYSKTFYNDF